MNHRFRFLHGLFACSLAILLPTILAAGFYFRTFDYVDDNIITKLVQPQPYRRDVLPQNVEIFVTRGIRGTFRADSLSNLQLELDFKDPMTIPKVGLFWCANHENWRGIAEWHYIGPVLGTGRQRFALPADVKSGKGVFILASVVTQEIIERSAMPNIQIMGPAGTDDLPPGVLDDTGL